MKRRGPLQGALGDHRSRRRRWRASPGAMGFAGRAGAASASGGRNWSGRPGSNRGPPAPKAGALPGCATPRRSPRHGTKLSQPRRFPIRFGPARRQPSLTPRPPTANAFDNPCYVPLPFSPMSVISDAIAERESQIERLQAEIKALSDVEKMLGDPAPQPRRRARRSPSPRKPAPAAAAPAAAAPADTASEAKPRRKRRQMTPEEKKAVSERMTAYWAARRKKSGK